MVEQLEIVIIGLSITSSWGNGHATTYRGLVGELCARGHSVLFLERDAPWYAENRDLPKPPFCRTCLYESVEELKAVYGTDVRSADLCIVGSFTPDGADICEWVTALAKGVSAFYDIDTPVTLAKLERGEWDYLTPRVISRFDLYLSFTGGPTLQRLEQQYASPMARALYCAVDPLLYAPTATLKRWDLGYMGTYSDDRQPSLERLLVEPARRWREGSFVVAGPQYPTSIRWPANISRIQHLAPATHREFYNSQRFTLNITRAEMIAAGYSPSVRLFEAAACATPIISDFWAGLDEFFEIGTEILVAKDSREALRLLTEVPENERIALGGRARKRVLAEHTAGRRAEQLEDYVEEAASHRQAVICQGVGDANKVLTDSSCNE
jgi:spore maturation protein CgeB